jgi:exodeoxyribonuclease V alpha subunit
MATRATGKLRELNDQGLLDVSDVHLAMFAARVSGESQDSLAAIGVALASKAYRSGSTGVTFADLAEVINSELEIDRIGSVLDDSAIHRFGLLTIQDGIVFLRRAYDSELRLAELLVRRLEGNVPPADARLQAHAQQLLPDLTVTRGQDVNRSQRDAVIGLVTNRTAILTGGPGTGKSTTVAAFLRLVTEAEPGQRIALAAPTGKAAARMSEAIADAFLPELLGNKLSGIGGIEPDEIPKATTLHRLLGTIPGSRTKFRHNQVNQLPFDLIVVDEASMVSLQLMESLVAAVKPTARLVFVGDVNQLASVEAGAVLADIITGLPDGLTQTLDYNHRSEKQIAALADAIRRRSGDEVTAILEHAGPSGKEAIPNPQVSWQPLVSEPSTAISQAKQEILPKLIADALELQTLAANSAEAALAALGSRRMLCAHRQGYWGVAHWNKLVEEQLNLKAGQTWYVGRPILITQNDYSNLLYNGDTGVVVRHDGNLALAFAGNDGEPVRLIEPTKIGEHETMFAMTIHKSQGSEAKTITVLLPPAGDPLLTNELLYTGITRAKKELTIVATLDAVVEATTTPTARTTGLAARLAESETTHVIPDPDPESQLWPYGRICGQRSP